jgi:hypothetical protein
MEGLTRLVSESLARHGFDRPLDYRRLRWSRWFRCESHHSLLVVPSQPGVFALAEEIMNLGSKVEERRSSDLGSHVEERRFSAASGSHSIAALAAAGISAETTNRKPEAAAHRRMLAVTQFFEDDDMAFVLDRMLSRQNPMSVRLSSGRYFVRFVVIEDPIQRRSICSALNQWMVSAAEKATGIGSHFATSLELTPATEYVPADDAQQSLFATTKDVVPEEVNVARAEDKWAENKNVARAPSPATAAAIDIRVGRTLLSATASATNIASLQTTAPQLSSGAATNIHCPTPFPSGF